jgi:hypothetical protein
MVAGEAAGRGRRILRRAPAAAILVLALLLGARRSHAKDEAAAGKTKAGFRPLPSRPLLGPIVLEPVQLPAVSEAEVAQAVDAGLAWLAAHQQPEGRWGVRTHAEWCDGKRLPPGQRIPAVGFQGFAVSVTALAANALMEAGHSPADEDALGTCLRRALDHLAGQVDPDSGGVSVPAKAPRPGTTGNRWVFDHAFACWALCRAAAITGWYRYAYPARVSLAFSEVMRNPYFAWRYGIKPGDNDTCVTACMLLGPAVALDVVRAATRQGVRAPIAPTRRMFKGAAAWLGKVIDPDTGHAGYDQRAGGPGRYQNMHPPGFDRDLSESCTAMACLVRLWMGEDVKRTLGLARSVQQIEKVGLAQPAGGKPDEWHLWFASDVMRRLASLKGRGGKEVLAWRARVARRVLDLQEKGGARCGALGSWSPDGTAWGSAGGRVYSTAVALMTLLRCAYDRVGEGDPGQVYGDRKQPVARRLDALMRLGPTPDAQAVHALRVALVARSPFVRTGAADSAARAGHEARGLRSALETRIPREADASARAAEVWALYRVAGAGPDVVKVLEPLATDADARVRFLAAYVLAVAQGSAPTERAAELDRRTSAFDALEAAERRGWLHAPPRLKRAAALRWRLLDDDHLPSVLDTRPDRRIPLVRLEELARPGVLEAVEACLAPGPWTSGTLPQLRGLHAAARNAISGPAPAAVRLRAVLALEFARRFLALRNPRRILPLGETQDLRLAYARQGVRRAVAELADLAERCRKTGHAASRRAALLLSAFADTRTIALLDVYDKASLKILSDAAGRLSRSASGFGVFSGGRFLTPDLLDAAMRLGAGVLQAARRALQLGTFVDALTVGAQEEAGTVDGRRAVVRAATVRARALLLVATPKQRALADALVPLDRDRTRMPDLGRSGDEIDLLLAWGTLRAKVASDVPGGRRLLQEARDRARALGDARRVKRAEDALKALPKG